MTIVGELTPGVVSKQTEDKCRTCSAADQKLTPGSHCLDVHACARRRRARIVGEPPLSDLRTPCIVKIQTRGSTYYLREFQPKMAPMPLVLEPGFTPEDYMPKGVLYEAVMEPGGASMFSVADALRLARRYDGVVENK